MIEFNSNNIFVGQIKQMLANFNLPNYNNGKWANEIPGYYYNQKILNVTRNFPIKNNIYDADTHEYLGEYLRFKRDYLGIDLMPLYNCFSNRLCNQLNFNVQQTIVKTDVNITDTSNSQDTTDTTKKIIVNFNTKDTNYKIYMIPIKFGKQYTIAIDNSGDTEMFCGFFGKYFNSDASSIISEYTFRHYTDTKYNSPEVYSQAMRIIDELQEQDKLADLKKLKSLERDLKLFIKVPAKNESAITILEGNYKNYNNIVLKKIKANAETSAITKIEIKKNQTVSSADAKTFNNFRPITTLQLLSINAKKSFPFASRLLEYLTGNAITDADPILDNIKRVQEVMLRNGIPFGIEGVWEPKIRWYIYEQMQKIHQENHDILGYIDKTAETYYYTTNSAIGKVSIAGIDIYEDIYLDSKVKED